MSLGSNELLGSGLARRDLTRRARLWRDACTTQSMVGREGGGKKQRSPAGGGRYRVYLKDQKERVK